jgi:hypothetical protein
MNRQEQKNEKNENYTKERRKKRNIIIAHLNAVFEESRKERCAVQHTKV